jgi:N-acetyl-gamma-glutamyl-phosphate reductase
MLKVGVVGASGYLGAELLRLIAAHPEMKLVAAQGHTNVNVGITELYPGLGSLYEGVKVEAFNPDALSGLDLVFLALPFGLAAGYMENLLSKVPVVVDLSADFRLKDAGLYDKWYRFTHPSPQLLEKAVYALPELYRERIKGASLISSPGCYVTAAALCVRPFVEANILDKDTSLIVDGASGTSGAGRSLTEMTHHSYINENFVAYGLLDHRHTPEMEQVIGTQVLFTPHLLPMTRGILVTCYAKVELDMTTEELLEIQRTFYADETFIRITEKSPATGNCYGSNTAELSVRYDKRTSHLIMLAAIDNLCKGGAGQALQSANIALGIEETYGLTQIGVIP